MIIIGIESSCDETAVAVVKDKKEVLSSVVASQIDVHTEFGGVVPEVASRIHVENISYCIEKALKDANITMEDVDAVAVTQGPGLIGCLHVGVQAAKTLAFAYHKPLVPVHHLAGHIYANELVVDMKYPVLALVVSGGNTELVYMKASKGTLQKRLHKRNQSLNANSPFIITNEILEHHYNDFQEPCGEGEKVILQEEDCVGAAIDSPDHLWW